MSCRFRSRLKFAAEDVVFECLNRAGVSILGFFSSFESVVRGCGTSRVVPFEIFDIVVAFFSIDVTHEGSLRIVVFDKRPGNDLSYGVVLLVAVFVNQTDYFGAVSQLAALENSFFGNRSVASCRFDRSWQTHDFASIGHHVASFVTFDFFPDHVFFAHFRS